jgi:glycosyltransferase involved in cell wall biosynthesis
MKISVFNGGGQTDYMFGLITGLAQYENDSIYVLDCNLNSAIFSQKKNIEFISVINVLPKGSPKIKKIANILLFYLKQFYHLTFSKRGIAHFQWLDRFYIPDRIFLTAWARLMGHKVILTVHNVNSKKRDNTDTWINRATLKAVYKISHRLIVHTNQSKADLMFDFSVHEAKIAIIRHGMNNKVSVKGQTSKQSRAKLGINDSDKIILFFGNIDYYKGTDLLLESIGFLEDSLIEEIRVVLAGNAKSRDFYNQIEEKIINQGIQEKVIKHNHYIADEDVETYFMAADCIVLPYRDIYQSGVIFMAYAFGLPVIVPDIANFKNDIEQGKTGFLVSGNEPIEIAKTLTEYFNSPVYQNLTDSRDYIKKWASDRYSWASIGKETRNLYKSLF